MSLSTGKSWGNWNWNHYNKSKLSNMKLYWSSFQKYDVYCVKVKPLKRLNPNYIVLGCNICSKKVAKTRNPYLHYFLLFCLGNSLLLQPNPRDAKQINHWKPLLEMLEKFSFTVRDNYQDRLLFQALAEPGVRTNRDSVFVTPVYLGSMFQWTFWVIIYD